MNMMSRLYLMSLLMKSQDTNKKSDAKAYMLRMLMNHSPEWIREDKLFDTVKENFTGFEDETLKVLIMSLVNYEDSSVLGIRIYQPNQIQSSDSIAINKWN